MTDPSTFISTKIYIHKDLYLKKYLNKLLFRLEVVLSKRESGLLWPELVVGDKRGHQVIDSTLADEVHARLSHLCTDSEVTILASS